MRCQLFVSIGIFSVEYNGKSIASCKIIHHLCCSCVFLLITQIINLCFTINICTKTVQSKTFLHIESIITVIINNNMKIVGQTVPVFGENLQYLVCDTI